MAHTRLVPGLKFALFGLHRGSGVDPNVRRQQAELAEQAGFEALWVGDHIAMPRDLGAAAELARLEALIALSYLSAVTKRVRLGIGVIVLPQRQPVLLAKQLSSIDVLSGGRLTVGIGVGYVEAELRALGVSLSDRGARTDEYLRVIKQLWMETAASFSGRFVSFESVVQKPTPVQKPHPPIVIGGSSAAAYRRAVVSGNGWYGWQLDLAETAAAIADLHEAMSRYERPKELGDLEITITPSIEIDAESARAFADLGVQRLALQPPTTDAAAMEKLITVAGDRLIERI
jgi:probable F420-dependent oxidoreductase